jgi:hypothetical protein
LTNESTSVSTLRSPSLARKSEREGEKEGNHDGAAGAVNQTAGGSYGRDYFN